ncbi:hypothetical protein CP533_1033 [Ophiocordyceps camponoti-saundersi (nom. inval.)]|nr:hypothetical protein CP533_1033 [Ophiocordyceps camponoti-saundersi (nom. inval.)]
MARDGEDDGAGQSKRPALNHRDTDTAHNTPAPPAHPPRKKHHHVGRLHARVPSSKAISKQVGHGAKLTRPDADTTTTVTAAIAPNTTSTVHRRVTSEVRLPSRASAANVSKSASHTSLKRNRSHVEVSKHNHSSDKLKRTASGSGIHHHRHKTSKSQVHFDLGSDDPDEDDWVDASGFNSPHLSRKPSLNSGGQSSPSRPAASSLNATTDSRSQEAQPCAPSSPDRETSHHKAYLTSRLLQRTPSQGAPPKMTVDFAQAARPQLSVSHSTDLDISPPTASNSDELTSRFVDVPGSALASHGSFYCPPDAADQPTLRLSSATAGLACDAIDTAPSTDNDDSVLVPRPARRNGALPAETSRVQQKLNLQRASSVLEPGQAVTGVGGVVGASPLIGIGGSSFESCRDPRVGKLLERTGMEYLVVRRYQNPVSRSINRLGRSLGWDNNRRTPRGTPASMNGHKHMDLNGRHTRNASTPETRLAIMTRRPASVRTVGTGASFDGDGVSRLSERLSGPSVVGADEEDGTTALLRSIWDRSMDLGAGAD